MKKSWKGKGLLLLILLLSLCFAIAACAGKTPPPTGDGGDGGDGGDDPGPVPTITYKIEEEFDDPTVDYANWDNGDVKNMHEVSGGKLILRHTGVTDYPSKGRNVKVSVEKYPYIAVKVDSLDGPNPTWGLKLMTPADATPSRTVQTDTNLTGVMYYDLRTIDGLAATGDLSFGMYFYILGGTGNSMTIDYVRSIEKIPTVENFNAQGNITVSDGTLAFTDGQMTVSAQEGKTAKVNVPMYCDFDTANMVDLFVNSVSDGGKWSLTQGEKTLIAETANYGALAVDGKKLGLNSGEGTLTLSVKGTVAFDQLRNVAYNAYDEKFDYETDELLAAVWTESGSGYIETNAGGMLLQKVPGVAGAASVSSKLSTNVSVYPKLTVKLASVEENTVVSVAFAGRTVLSGLTAAGTYTYDLTTQYLSDLGSFAIAISVAGDGEETEESELKTVVERVALESDAEMCKNALPPKGEKTEREGSLIENGNNADNWIGDAKVIARGGQLEIIQNSSAGYSKGQVFAKNVDLAVNRYLNIKIDEVSAGATYKVDVRYDVDLEGMKTETVVADSAKTGIITIDLYKTFALTDENKLTSRISYDVFIVGGIGATLKLDYIRNDDKIDEAPQIVNVTPSKDTTIVANSNLAVGASLKYHSGAVTITVKDATGTDVTADTFQNGQFSAAEPGVYTVTFSYTGAESVTRTITVESAEKPSITVTTPDSNITANETLTLEYLLANAPQDATVIVTAWLNGEDVTSAVLSDDAFTAADTGVYTIKFNYTGATEQTITVTVSSMWKTSGDDKDKLTIEEKNGKVYLNASADYPKATRDYKNIVINDTPYVKITINEASTAKWKLMIGSESYFEQEVQGETDKKGTLYFNIKDVTGFTEEHWAQQKTVTLGVMVVAYGEKNIIIDSVEFISQAEYDAANPA